MSLGENMNITKAVVRYFSRDKDKDLVRRPHAAIMLHSCIAWRGVLSLGTDSPSATSCFMASMDCDSAIAAVRNNAVNVTRQTAHLNTVPPKVLHASD